MTRDYSKKKPVKRKPSATPKTAERKSFGGLIYMGVGLSIGLFIAFLVYLGQQPVDNSKKLVHPANFKNAQSEKNIRSSKSKSSAKTKKLVNKTTKKAIKPTKPVAQVPEYEFYTMLPDVEIEVNVPEVIDKTTTKTDTAKVLTNKPVANKSTINKTITNKSFVTARQTKTRNIKETTAKTTNKTLYQLQVGAFQAKGKAESMKAQLAFMGVQSKISSNILTNGKRVYKVKIGPSSDQSKLKLIKVKLKKMNINTFLHKI